MEAIFQNSKNDEKTVILNGFFFHSNYNPSKEAERFVQNLAPTFLPEIIFVTEPGLSYCAKFLKEKYPLSKIVAVRYANFFGDYDSAFDRVINFFEYEQNSLKFENFLLNEFGEEKLLSSFFCSWNASSKVFPQIDKIFWNSVKNATQKAKTLLITSQYFETKWFKNSVIFFKYAKNLVVLKKKIQKDVLIIASGPSLKKAADVIAKNQKSFFIIALSSAIKFCIKNKIIPDLCFSTDGGYWAGQHLKILADFPKIPIAITPESFCPKKILTENKILPLIYDDGISATLAKKSGLEFLNAKRNGTVSGTALDFALKNSAQNIYFFGLDLCAQKGFQHSAPNELQLNSRLSDGKLNSAEKKSAIAQFSNSNLKIYEDWFASFETKNRKIYRIIDEEFKKNSLGQIKDVSSDEFKKIAEKKNENRIEKEDFFQNRNAKTNIDGVCAELKHIFFDESVKKQFYPLDFILLKHTNNDEIQKKIDEKQKKLYEKALATLN